MLRSAVLSLRAGLPAERWAELRRPPRPTHVQAFSAGGAPYHCPDLATPTPNTINPVHAFRYGPSMGGQRGANPYL